MKNTEISKESIVAIISKGQVKSLTGISKELGFKGSVSGAMSKRIKENCPEVLKLLKANMVIAELGNDSKKPEKSKNAIERPVKVAAKKPTHTPARDSQHASNPFRAGSSSYGKCWEILFAHKNGIHKAELVKLLAKETGKDLKRAYYDTQVLMSAKISNTGPRHRSCKEGFWIKKENAHVTLMID